MSTDEPTTTDADPAFVTYFHYTHFDPVLPSVMQDGEDAVLADVTIVGGGPIGFALAVALGRQGVRCVVLEADDSVCLGSRAGCVTRRTLEIFEQLGVADATMRQGLPWSEGWSYYRTQEVFHLQMPADEDAKYPSLVNIQQCYVEQYLVDEIARLGDSVDLRWQNRVTDIRQDADGVAIQVSTPAGDYRMRSRWVVACDGAHSFVRRALGLRFTGTRYEGRYIIVDIKMRSDLQPGRRAWFDPPSNPGSTLLLHKHRDDLWRFDYQVREDEDPQEAVRPQNVLARVRSHLDLMGEKGPWNPVWISLYSASCLTLEQYRHGRVLLAGDAAHLVPIFGVRGMNSGIEDIHNLAWKLALVCKGVAGDALLDTYSQERVFATRENMRHSSKSAEFMAPPSSAFARMRTAVLSLAQNHTWVRSLVNPRQSTAIGLPQSPLNIVEHESRFDGGPPPGTNIPDLSVEGRHLTTLLGPHFTIITFVEGGGALTQSMHEQGGVAVKTIRAATDGLLARRLDAQAGTTYLVRPDGHILGRWRRPDPSVLTAAIDDVCHFRSAT